MIITEIGLNHMGDEVYAIELVNKLIKTNVDGISFQIREPDFYKKYPNLLLNKNFYINIKNLIKKNNKYFGIALCDASEISFFDDLEVDFFKIINRDINNFELINKMLASKVKTIYLSTGLSDLNEIKNCLSNITENYSKKIILVHTQLDHSLNGVNLRSIEYLKSNFKLPVAFGLHSKKFEVMYMSLCYLPDGILFYIKGNNYEFHLDEDHAVAVDLVLNLVNNLKKLPLAIGKLQKLKPSSPLDIL
tara:strand:+ start:48 stop:791 length:744 start_codon:yes stop_codon:yes gene_type:complete